MAPSWTNSLVIGGVKVKPAARSLVVPATPTDEHWLRLSNLDRVVNPVFSSVILFYSKLLVRSNRTYSEILQSLKDCLAIVLVDFYPLAGRLALRDDGLVDLHCNNQGAIFVEASVDAALEEVGGAQPMPALSGLEVARLGPGPFYIPDQLNPMPALIIQVTQFKKCGSVAVAVNWHHTVADGSSGCHFIKSWSEVALGKDVSLKPDHDREQLRPRNPLDSSLVNGYSTRSVQDLLPGVRIVPTEPPLLRCFPLPKEAAQRLKSQAKTEDCEYTSAQAISGHLWKMMTKARVNMSSTADYESAQQTTRFFMFVDGRKKLGLSKGYFGNAICSACAVSSEEDILTKPISYAANLIKNATTNTSDKYFRSLIDWVEEQGQSPSKSEHVNSLGHDVAATFWTFFSLYEMDFGWGKPSFAVRNSGPRPLIDGIAMMPSPEGPGHMVAVLNLHADRMTRLERDTEFSTIYCSASQQQQRSAALALQLVFSAWSFCIKVSIAMLVLAWNAIELAVQNCPNFDGKSGVLYEYHHHDGHSTWEQQQGVLQRVTVLQLVFSAWRFCIKSSIAMIILTWKVIELAILICPNFDGKPVVNCDGHSLGKPQQGYREMNRIPSSSTSR